MDDNPFSETYHELSYAQDRVVRDIRDTAKELWSEMCKGPPCRARSIALTKLEEAVMWAVKGVTQ